MGHRSLGDDTFDGSGRDFFSAARHALGVNSLFECFDDALSSFHSLAQRRVVQASSAACLGLLV